MDRIGLRLESSSGMVLYYRVGSRYMKSHSIDSRVFNGSVHWFWYWEFYWFSYWWKFISVDQTVLRLASSLGMILYYRVNSQCMKSHSTGSGIFTGSIHRFSIFMCNLLNFKKCMRSKLKVFQLLCFLNFCIMINHNSLFMQHQNLMYFF